MSSTKNEILIGDMKMCERFWIDDKPDIKPFADFSFGVVDEEQGGVVAYFGDTIRAADYILMLIKEEA